MASGLTADGLVIEAVDDIRTALEQDLRDTFFSSLPLGDNTLLGHLVGIVAEQLGLQWERLEQINSSQDPDKATGPALDALAVLTGTFRQPATKSTAVLTLTGDPSTTVAASSVVATASTSALFDTRDDVTLVLLTSWASLTPYAVGDRVTNSGNCYQCITAGTSASSGGPATTASDITDGSVHWEFLGVGTAAIDVNADAELTGPTVAVAGDLSVIQTPVAGWNTVTNLLDAALGADEDTDEQLRILRQLELAGNGASTKDAIRAAILKIKDVISCTMFVNSTDVTDGDGLPPHSFETLVRGGDDQTITDTIANELPIGIATYGSTSGTHTDSEGTSETINWSRPSDVLIYVVITQTYDATLYPSDGNTQTKTDVATYGDGYPVGRDVDPSALAAQAFQVDGVLGVQEVLVYDDVIGTPVAWAGTTGYVATVGSRSVVTNDGGRKYICITSGTSAGSGGPTGTATDITDGTVHWRFLGAKYVIAARELAVFDTTRITVNSSAVTP